MAGKFEVYEDRAGKHRFRLKTSYGQTIATGDGFPTKHDAKVQCSVVQEAAHGATIEEVDA